MLTLVDNLKSKPSFESVSALIVRSSTVKLRICSCREKLIEMETLEFFRWALICVFWFTLRRCQQLVGHLTRQVCMCVCVYVLIFGQAVAAAAAGSTWVKALTACGRRKRQQMLRVTWPHNQPPVRQLPLRLTLTASRADAATCRRNRDGVIIRDPGYGSVLSDVTVDVACACSWAPPAVTNRTMGWKTH